MDVSVWTDRVAIRHRIDKFSLGVTIRDEGAISSSFVAAGAWRVAKPLEMSFSTARAIGAGIIDGLKRFEFLVQMVHSVVIDVSGDQATARSVIKEVGRLRDGAGGIQLYGVYQDDLQRDEADWYFTRRLFKPIFIDQTTPLGDVIGVPGE